MSVDRDSAGPQMVEVRSRDGVEPERGTYWGLCTLSRNLPNAHGMSPSESLGSGDRKILCHFLLEWTAPVRSTRADCHASGRRVTFGSTCNCSVHECTSTMYHYT